MGEPKELLRGSDERELDGTLISGYDLDMARIKVSTVLDEHLFRRAKLEAVRRDTPLAEVISEALQRYLADSGSRSATAGVVDATWGLLAIERSQLEELLAEEPGLLDS